MRRYPDRPVVGVGGVIVDADRVVLIKRAHEPLKGEWSLPGGAVEVGETLVNAVAREVREETGLDVQVGPIVETLDRIYPGEHGRVEYHFVLVDYLCTVVGGRLVQGSDAADACWASEDDLLPLGLSADTMRVIKKALELSRQARLSGA